MDNPGKLLLEDIGLRFEFSPLYRNWQDRFESGRFPRPTFPWTANSQGIRREVFPGNTLAVEPANFPKNRLPGLLFSNLYGNPTGIDLYSDSFNRRRVCVFRADRLPSGSGLARGNFLLFSGQLSLFTDAAEIKDSLGSGFP